MVEPLPQSSWLDLTSSLYYPVPSQYCLSLPTGRLAGAPMACFKRRPGDFSIRNLFWGCWRSICLHRGHWPGKDQERNQDSLLPRLASTPCEWNAGTFTIPANDDIVLEIEPFTVQKSHRIYQTLKCHVYP